MVEPVTRAFSREKPTPAAKPWLQTTCNAYIRATFGPRRFSGDLDVRDTRIRTVGHGRYPGHADQRPAFHPDLRDHVFPDHPSAAPAIEEAQRDAFGAEARRH